MAQLWGGRFTKATDEDVFAFNESLSFDQRLYKHDIKGSVAHVHMLGAQGILTDAEAKAIEEGLNGILADLESGALAITVGDPRFEDIHSFVESTLIDRIGETGKKLHTGRSRNDQVALDMRMYSRSSCMEISKKLKTLI